MRAIAIAAALLALSVTTVFAVKPHPIEEITRTELIAPLVEQQTPGGATQPDPSLWVINTTGGCVWDADDFVTVQYAGTLEDSFTATECIIADWTNHLVAMVVVVKGKPAPSLTASIHFTRDGAGVDASSSELIPRDRHWSEIRFCTFSNEYDNDDPTHEPVGDGVGWPTDVEFTVVNNGDKRIRDVSVRTIISSDSNRDIARWCPGGEE